MDEPHPTSIIWPFDTSASNCFQNPSLLQPLAWVMAKLRVPRTEFHPDSLKLKHFHFRRTWLYKGRHGTVPLVWYLKGDSITWLRLTKRTHHCDGLLGEEITSILHDFQILLIKYVFPQSKSHTWIFKNFYLCRVQVEGGYILLVICVLLPDF